MTEQQQQEQNPRSTSARGGLAESLPERTRRAILEEMGRAKMARRRQFERLTTQPSDAVFLNESITEGGLWREWFPEQRVCNRGVAGDTSSGVRDRLDSSIVDGPAVVSLFVGTNDLQQFGLRFDAGTLAADFLDLWPILVDDNGGRCERRTHDALHLTAAGYAVWADLLRPAVSSSTGVGS